MRDKARDPLTLFGPIEEPQVREGNFIPKSSLIVSAPPSNLPGRSLFYASGISTRGISQFIEAVYAAFHAPQSISRPAGATAEEVEGQAGMAEDPEDPKAVQGVNTPKARKAWKRSKPNGPRNTPVLPTGAPE